MSQYNSSNQRWTQYDSIAVVVDPYPAINTWTTWGANQWDLFFLNGNGEFVDHLNINTWNYDCKFD